MYVHVRNGKEGKTDMSAANMHFHSGTLNAYTYTFFKNLILDSPKSWSCGWQRDYNLILFGGWLNPGRGKSKYLCWHIFNRQRPWKFLSTVAISVAVGPFDVIPGSCICWFSRSGVTFGWRTGPSILAFSALALVAFKRFKLQVSQKKNIT